MYFILKFFKLYYIYIYIYIYILEILRIHENLIEYIITTQGAILLKYPYIT